MLLGVCNTMMAGHIGAQAVSAIGMVDSINMLFISFFAALSVGATVVVAQQIGQEQPKKANETAHDIAQRSIDTIKNKFLQSNTENVLFRGEKPSGIDLLTGKQKLKDLMPDFSGNVTKEIFGKPTLPNTQIDNDTLINNIIYSSNKLIGGK